MNDSTSHPLFSSSAVSTRATAIIAVFLVLVLSGCAETSGRESLESKTQKVSPNYGPKLANSNRLVANAKVDRVVDGDTIIVRSAGDRERIRLIGINTPESVHPTKPVECFGKKASQHTHDLLPKGTPVLLMRDVEPRDKYGRLLAYVYRADDALFVNLELVQNGFARAYRFPPNTTLSSQFAQAQSQAKKAGLGLWASCPADN